MAESNRVGVRLKATDEAVLLILANHLERGISGTLRFALWHTARDYGLLPPKNEPSLPGQASQAIEHREGGAA